MSEKTLSEAVANYDAVDILEHCAKGLETLSTEALESQEQSLSRSGRRWHAAAELIRIAIRLCNGEL